MTLRMADGPVANLPEGMDAYAGYVDDSGIGVTYPEVAARFPHAELLSISTHRNPAECADVESGAMRSWRGYIVGYCSVGVARDQVAATTRPVKLWTAHYGAGQHICGPRSCGCIPWTADGTQWIDHGGWDESLLTDSFFDWRGHRPAPPVAPTKEEQMHLSLTPSGQAVVVARDPNGHLLVFTTTAKFDGSPTQRWSVQDVTDQIGTPPGGQPYTVAG